MRVESSESCPRCARVGAFPQAPGVVRGCRHRINRDVPSSCRRRASRSRGSRRASRYRRSSPVRGILQIGRLSRNAPQRCDAPVRPAPGDRRSGAACHPGMGRVFAQPGSLGCGHVARRCTPARRVRSLWVRVWRASRGRCSCVRGLPPTFRADRGRAESGPPSVQASRAAVRPLSAVQVCAIGSGGSGRRPRWRTTGARCRAGLGRPASAEVWGPSRVPDTSRNTGFAPTVGGALEAARARLGSAGSPRRNRPGRPRG